MTEIDCENEGCENYGGLGCHGCDDPLNQTACKLELNDAKECLNGEGYDYFAPPKKGTFAEKILLGEV